MKINKNFLENESHVVKHKITHGFLKPLSILILNLLFEITLHHELQMCNSLLIRRPASEPTYTNY